MSLNTSLNLALNAALSGTAAVGGGTPQFSMAFNPLVGGTLPTGTGSAKADQLWTRQVTLAASGTLNIDLTSLGNDNIGNALAPVNLKVLAIVMKGSLGCTYVASASVHGGGGGTGYVVNDTLTVAGGTGTSAQLTVASVSSGAITAVSVKTVGSFTGGSYTANPTTTSNAVTGGTGTGASIDLTMATYAESSQVYVESDYISIGNDNTSNAWVSMLADKTDILKLYSGNLTLPGFLIVGNAGNTGYAIGSTNKKLLFTNSGSNPVTFNIIGIGATA